jgi:hypothetical protein
MIKILGLGTLLLISSLYSPKTFAEKDCYTCNPDYVPGSPVEGNKTLGMLAGVSRDLLSKNDSSFMANLYGFCMDFDGGEKGAKTFRKRVLNDMETIQPSVKVENYFLEAGCNPDNIGSTRSPLAHLAAEAPTVRMAHLEVIRKYFLEKNKMGMFTKILNAKNTKGHTTLDYLHYMLENKKLTEKQINFSGEFINYLCANGAAYSHYPNKSCGGTQMALK